MFSERNIFITQTKVWLEHAEVATMLAKLAPTCPAVDILSDALQLGCIVEVGRADGLSD